MLKKRTFLYLAIIPNFILAQIIPQILQIPEQFIPRSSNTMFVQAALSNQTSITDLVHWTKIFGPDEVLVNPQTGEVQWKIDPNLASESFYIGLKAYTPSGYSISSFIVHVGKSSSSEITYVGSGETYTSIKQGLAAMSSGGTMVVRNGTYSGNENFIGHTSAGAYQHPPSGTASELTTIMAESPGEVILTDNAYIRVDASNGNSVSYATFKGFFAVDGQIASFSQNSGPRNHHIKFTHCGANGYDVSDNPGNSNKPSIHLSPFNAFRSDYILFENCYAFGSGRYKFASYQSSNVVWRRNLARYDRGTVNGEPKGTFSVYNTWEADVSNNIVIDGDDSRFITTGEIAGDYTTPTTSGDTRAKMNRNIQLNSVLKLGNWDDQAGISDTEVEDIISWDCRPAGYWSSGVSEGYIYCWGAPLFNHATIGKIRPDYYSNQLFNGYHDNIRGIKNSIIHDITNGDLFLNFKTNPNFEIEYGTQAASNRLAPRYGVETVNLTAYDGSLEANGGGHSNITNITNLPPLYTTGNTDGALRYLVRVEPGSSLSGMGNNGSDIGANVMTFKGGSGTFYGDNGFDEETSIPQWPFPMEDLIHDKLAAYNYTGSTYTGDSYNRQISGTGTINGARGFAAPEETLTHYVWGYLGHLVPPMEVTISQSMLQWNQSINENIDSYKIYQTDSNGINLIFIAEVESNVMHYDLSGLGISSDAYIAVTTVKGTEESSYSYLVSVSGDFLNTKDDEIISSFLMYPNPTSGMIQITTEIEKVKMFNILGEKVLETSKNTYDISYLPSGIYIAHIETKKGTTAKKIIKE